MGFRRSCICSLGLICALVSASVHAETTGTNSVFSYRFYDKGDHAPFSGTGELDWSEDAKTAVARAMDTIAGMFSNDPSRKVNIDFLFVDLAPGISASTTPWTSSSPEATKSVWTAEDLNGRGVASNTGASVNNLEHVWKYGLGLRDDYGYADVTIHLSMGFYHMGLLYDGASPNGIGSNQLDLETLVLHEMGHALGFQAPGLDDRKTAFEVLTTDQGNNGFHDPFFDGQGTVAYLEAQGDKVLTTPTFDYDPSLGVSLAGGNFDRDNSHINNTYDYYNVLMEAGGLSGSTQRGFSDLELLMFKDMGWNLTHDPSLSVPEPSSVAFGLAGLLSLMLRRRVS